MKTFFTLLFLSISISFQTHAQGSLSTGLVLYLPFNGNTLDMSGNGNHATNYGATLTADAAGIPNSAYLFNGTSDYMKILNSVSLQCDSQISLCAKVKPLGYYKGPCYGNYLIKKGNTDYVSGSYGLAYSSPSKGCSSFDSSTQNYSGATSGAYPFIIAHSTPHIISHNWDCIVYTFNGDTGKMYVNGVLRYKYAQSAIIGKNSDDLFLGHMNSASYPYWVNGIIDEVRIYNRALSPKEVNDYCGLVSPINKITPDFSFVRTACLSYDFTDLSTTTISGIKLWQWTFGDGDFSSVKNPNHIYPSPGTYSVKLVVTDSLGNKDSITKALTISFTRFAQAGNDTIVCTNLGGTSLMLNASGGLSYSWSPAAGLSDAAIANPIATLSSSTSYIVTVTDAFGCVDKDTIMVTLKPGAVTVIATPDTASGCLGKEIQLTATGAKNYKWIPSSGLDHDDIANPKLAIVQSFQYVVVGTDTSGCSDRDTVDITMFPTPNVKATSNGETAKCEKSTVMLSATGAEAYRWSPDIYCEKPNSDQTIVFPTSKLVFTVTGTNAFGCVGQDTITVFHDGATVVRIPNTFSPNGDGLNDKIKPIIVCDFKLESYAIYSRWGKQMYITDNANAAWDGTSNGKPCDLGVYYYLIKGKNALGENVMLKGDITLVR